MVIARIAIPRPNVDLTWDYLVPGDLADSVRPGVRVLVDVGRSTETGYVTELADEPRTSRKLRPVREVLDEEPLVTAEILDLTRWLADYYLVSWGDAIKAALPAGINVREEEKLRITADGRRRMQELIDADLITEEEGRMVEALGWLRDNGPSKAADIGKEFSGNLISRLLGLGLVERSTSRTGRSLEKTLVGVQAVSDPPEMPEEFWNRSRKRRKAWEALREADEPVLLVDIEERLGASRSVVDGLVDAGLAEKVDVSIRRNPFKELDVWQAEPNPLTELQQSVHAPMAEALDAGRYHTFLLHGVTGSGKTEIYLHLARRAMERGRTVLILIPELSLTPQFVRRYYAAFGDDLAVMHSGLPLGERTDEWNRVRHGKAGVVLGTRLSIFAPLQDLGLIIVDEEHDQSYKQDDYPSFNARDVAVVRASRNGAVCVLGSATPSLESLHNAERGKYTLLELKKRVFDRPLPVRTLVDLRDPANRQEEDMLPPVVAEALEAMLERGEQALVMVGRKGYAPYVLCRACGHNFECNSCSISMTWHESLGKLKCHYCGRTAELPQICPECGSTSIVRMGMGTARVEEKLRSRFPTARIARMDRDVITRPREYQQVLDRLRHKEIDIMVGTQMLAKGHDYPDVTAVVTMGLDAILNLPDFRHSERLFQLLIQISGRAGRGEQPGKVFILTHRPNHYAVAAAAEMDFDGFLERELKYRASLRYPPYGYLCLVTVEDFDRGRGRAAAQDIVEKLREALEGKAYILGPNLAPYARLKNRWRHQVFIKAPDRSALNKAVRRIRTEHSGPSQLKITVDPVSVM